MLFALLASLSFTLLAVPGGASAASVALTTTAQTALDKHIASAPSTTKDKLIAQYGSLTSYQRQEDRLNDQYSTLHASNDKALEAVRLRLKQLDAAKLQRLANDVAATRTRYEPLLSYYTALNARIRDARALKLTMLTSVLNDQADAIRPAVQLAKAEIKYRDEALRVAKAETAKAVKAYKETLAGIDAFHAQTRTAQSVVSGAKKGIPGIIKTLNACVKSGSHSGTLQSLTTLSSLSRAIVDQKTRIIGHENNVTAIIALVNAQIRTRY